MGAASQPPLTLWAVSDGRAGIEAQALGLAEAVARLRPAEVAVKRIGWRWGLGQLPAALNPGLPWTLAPGSGIAPPWPDIWIAAGRATLPLSRRMRTRSAGRTFVVQTQDPRGGLADFDLVVPPLHDGLSGPSVFPIAGAPTRLTAERLAEAAGVWAERLGPLPRPRVAAIIGGRSKAHDLPEAHARDLALRIRRAVETAGGSLLLSFTRRTPEPARRAMREVLGGLPGLIWDDRGDNPYFGFLALADAVLVTEDSTNLATDAAATGRPVHILPMAGAGSEKFRRFHADLAGRGISRPFTGSLESWSYAPLAETERSARELLRRYDAQV
ncbi:mitochondrial fission ELM1 family protein [Phenylobacterium sp. J367]|uniref:mitochondrial fission ELM1 family protein n=1 Tax=Phenylobacterium sp. J367 TaxID=2898435 RepID=UPI0021509D6E|nr:mitochondrial fission ELM1 family protein [Phenylobacterium sp. J367]MCR5877054.1 mitochondrial fission ELM1 family protein [Phenylobacterium sp. J367]